MRIKLNYKTAGKKFGAMMKTIEQSMLLMTDEEINMLVKLGKKQINMINGDRVILTSEDVIVTQ